LSDLGLPLVLLTIAVGYFLKKKQENYTENDFQYIINPNGQNVYTSNTVNETTELMLNKSVENYAKGQNPYETGFVPPFFNFPQSGKNSTNLNDAYIEPPSAQLQAEIDDYNKISTFHQKDQAQVDISTMPIFDSTLKYTQADIKEAEFTNFNSSNDQIQTTSELTGLPLINAHENMVPFFGSNIKQNMEAFANVPLIDNYTGNADTFIHKQESGPLFPTAQQDIYGTTPVTDIINKDRFNLSNYRENERPFEPTRISALHEGSYDIPRIRDKTIDQLRPGNKPRISYAARTVDNQKSSVRGIQGKFNKYHVDRSFEQTPDMLLKGSSQYLKKGYYEENYDNIKSKRSEFTSSSETGNPHSSNRSTYQSVILGNMDC
jgi:hypothetical protein